MSQALPRLPVLTAPTLDEHCAKFPASLLECVVADDVLVKLSTSIAEWRELSPFLQLTPAEERAIITALPPATPPRQCIDALRKWREKMGQRATHRLLIETLHQAKRADLIDELCTILTSSNTTLTPPSTQNVEISKIHWYSSYLKDRYKKRAIKSFSQWPPSPTEKIFNLAIIKKEKIQRGKIDDEFVRLTITGKVDDILLKKSPVVLKSIFKSLKGRRKVVLIEGAPGAGKSTLSLDICERWGEGELFREYEVAILVRLRDPLVQQAKNIKELLPYVDATKCKEIASCIEANNGRGVLWVLDGWDELPSNMSEDSILHKLIQPDTPLHESSVIVTSRPIASADLHKLVNQRIEIVGFTPEERNKYFTECLKGDSKAVETLMERIQAHPVIEGSCYLPLNAAIIIHLFLTSEDGSLPTTQYGIFSSVVLGCIYRSLERDNKSVVIESLEHLPEEVKKPFESLCELAYQGVMENKVTFCSSDLSCDNLLGLLQGVESLIFIGKSISYNFLHLSIQELLAAFHIATKFEASEQVSKFKKLYHHSHFSAVFQFYAAITKLQTPGIRSVITTLLSSSDGSDSSVYSDVGSGVGDSEGSDISKGSNDDSYSGDNFIDLKDSKPLLVSLIHCLYEAQDQSLCQFVAEQLGGELNLSYTTLTPVDCLAIGYFLSNLCITIHSMFRADLEGCSIDDQCCKFFMRGLCKCVDSHNTVTTHLDMYLWYNNISSDGAHHIAHVLHNTSVVYQLTLSDNPIGSDGVKFISEALITNSSLVELDLSYYCSVEITEENGPVLCEMLKQNKTLAHLVLSGNKGVSDTGVKFISCGLNYNTTLMVLRLSGCGITSKTTELLASLLVVNKSLVDLSIGNNDIGNGVYDIANSLKHNNSLMGLDLNDCHITDQGVESIAKCLIENKTLKELRLHGNDDITDEGLSLLTNALVTNTVLETVWIPEHLKSSSANMEKTINEARKRCGLPTIKVDLDLLL